MLIAILQTPKVVEREKEEREAIESKLEEAEKERKKLRRQVTTDQFWLWWWHDDVTTHEDNDAIAGDQLR